MCFSLEACIRSYVESPSTRALFCKLTTMYLYDFDRYNSQDINTPQVCLDDIGFPRSSQEVECELGVSLSFFTSVWIPTAWGPSHKH